jgi:hypothetical protein
MLALGPSRMRGAVITPCPTPHVNPVGGASLPAIAGYLRTGHALVPLPVSFGYVLPRPARTTEDGQPRSPTLLGLHRTQPHRLGKRAGATRGAAKRGRGRTYPSSALPFYALWS